MKKYIDLEDMVNLNCSNVLNIIQKNGSVSRKQITQLSGLSWGGMTKIVNRLLEHEYIIETRQDKASSSGRIPSVLSVNTKKNFVVGIDINRTGLSAIVMDLTGEILKSFSGTAAAKSRESFVDEIVSFTEKVFADFKAGSIISIGVAMQGIVDCKNGISVKFPAIGDWENVPVKEIFENKFGVDVFVEHDPDCLLYPHMDYGLKENIVLLRIDKSIGMAVAIGGKIIKGKGVFEIAHNTVIPNGAKCRCGLRGCVEAYIRPCVENGKVNDKKIEELILPLAITVKNLSALFNTDRIILIGTLMEHSGLFQNKLCKVLADNGCNVQLEFSKVADFAVRGAALIAVNKSINSLLI